MSDLTITTHDANVDRGVEFLDERLGRDVWLPRLNVLTLDVATLNRCVVCQATGVSWYGEGLESIGVTLENMVDADGGLGSWTERRGFGLKGEGSEPRDFAGLNETWVRKIVELRAEGVA